MTTKPHNSAFKIDLKSIDFPALSKPTSSPAPQSKSPPSLVWSSTEHLTCSPPTSPRPPDLLSTEQRECPFKITIWSLGLPAPILFLPCSSQVERRPFDFSKAHAIVPRWAGLPSYSLRAPHAFFLNTFNTVIMMFFFELNHKFLEGRDVSLGHTVCPWPHVIFIT